jgi:hypothetical protein
MSNLEQFSNNDLLLMSKVLNDTLLEFENLNDEESKKYTLECFNLLQKVIRNFSAENEQGITL